MPTTPLQGLSETLADVVAAVAGSVVAVQSRRARSSGFVWRPGLIVTADEALADEGSIEVSYVGGTALATLAGRDATTDIALLRVPDAATLPPVVFAPSAPRAGSLAVAVGSHDGMPSAALGIVGSTGPAWRSMRGGDIDARIELDLALRRSSEGGVVLDASSQAIGMAVFGPRRRVLVIPGSTIDRVAARLQEHGRVSRGYLGLGMQPVRTPDGKSAIMVMSVDRQGPGLAAGMYQGDVIVGLDGQPVGSVSALLRVLGPESVGATVVLAVIRGGELLDVRLVVGERQAG